MRNNDPYSVIKSLYVTEKSIVLQQLKESESNKSIRAFDKPKYVFLVDVDANKIEIKEALEKIYLEKKIKVTSVNTVSLKPKKRRVRGKVGFKPAKKKAIVTLEKGDSLDNI